jgi:transcriptional regulator with XRE-family HTH domain
METQDLKMGPFIRQQREARGLSLRALAGLLSISAAHQSDIEHGRRRPSPELMRRIAETLKVDLQELKVRDARMGEELKQWMEENPSVVHLLHQVRDRDAAELLIMAWQKTQASRWQ